MPPLISIIIPVYNQAKELRLALDSIQKQTYKNLEVIVVDDGSGTKFQISPPKADKFPINRPIKFLSQKHAGAPTARNRGLELAKGEYVIFWDADIVAKPKMLEKMYGVLQIARQASYCYSNFQFLIFNFQTIFNFKFYKQMRTGEFDIQKLKQNNFIHSTSLIRRKDAIRWDESLKRFQDWDLWLTMAEDGKTGVWVDEYLFTIISHGTMSHWLPSFCYKKPFCYLPLISGIVKQYNRAREIINKKHKINLSTLTV